jgi:hypothetical protein
MAYGVSNGPFSRRLHGAETTSCDRSCGPLRFVQEALDTFEA